MMLRQIKIIHMKTQTAIINQTQLHRKLYYAERQISVIKFYFPDLIYFARICVAILSAADEPN